MARILIVDDSLVARMSIKSCIPKDEGHELKEAVDAEEALSCYRAFQPDITFLDLTMPDRNGLEVLEEIRGEFPEALVIILSADIQKQTQERANELGAFAIVKKPPKRENVLPVLSRALKSKEGA